MTVEVLRNFCLEPETKNCTCELARCGGIVMFHASCPEHGVHVALERPSKSHRHAVKGFLVGSLIAS